MIFNGDKMTKEEMVRALKGTRFTDEEVRAINARNEAREVDRCHMCGEEIGTTAGVRIPVSVPLSGQALGEGGSYGTEKRWVHVSRDDCDGLTWVECDEHKGMYWAREGGHGCPTCTLMWSI